MRSKKRSFKMKFEKEIFMKYLIEREASEATKKKYMTDVTTFYSYAAEAEEIDKELLLAYREWLVQHYAVSSVNSMLVALNQYLLAVRLENGSSAESVYRAVIQR